YALDRGEMLDHLIVGAVGQPCEIHRARPRVPREIADVFDLLPRQAERPHTRRPQLQQRFRRQTASCRLDHTAVDRLRYLSAKLLRDNGLDQGLEVRFQELDTIRPNPFDYGPQYGVGILEVLDGFTHVETIARRDTSPFYRYALDHVRRPLREFAHVPH